MNRRTALAGWIRYRLLAALAFVVGAAIAGLGIWLGIRPAIQFAILNIVGEPNFVEETLARVRTGLMAGLVVVGIVVWQVGKTVAFWVTIGKLIESTDDPARSARAGAHPEQGPDRMPRGDGIENQSETRTSGDAGVPPGTEAAGQGTTLDRDSTHRDTAQGPATYQDAAETDADPPDARGGEAADGDVARGDAGDGDSAN